MRSLFHNHQGVPESLLAPFGSTLILIRSGMRENTADSPTTACRHRFAFARDEETEVDKLTRMVMLVLATFRGALATREAPEIGAVEGRNTGLCLVESLMSRSHDESVPTVTSNPLPESSAIIELLGVSILYRNMSSGVCAGNGWTKKRKAIV